MYRPAVAGVAIVALRGIAGCISDARIDPNLDAGALAVDASAHSDAALADANASEAGSVVVSRRVFASSTTPNGNVKADDECTRLGQTVHAGATFAAWTPRSPSEGPLAKLPPQGLWVDTVGTTIANHGDLANFRLQNPVQYDEAKHKLSETGVIVWTGVAPDGGVANANCKMFTSSNSLDRAQTGRTEATSGGWSSTTADFCDQAHHLLCFEL